MSASPRVPAGLGVAGRAFWRSVHGKYVDLLPAELVLLGQVCRTLDLIADLERQVDADGVTVPGSRGQVRTHPAVTEARLQRAALARLLDQIGLPAELGESAQPSSPAARRASRAARARWDRVARRRAGEGSA